MNVMSAKKYYKMSGLQEKLYVYTKLYNNDPSYNLNFCYKMTGALDVPRFIKVCEYLFNYYESFKVNFVEIDNKRYQCFDETRQLKVDIVDLKSAGISDYRQFIEGEAVKMSEQPFALAEWPLMRMKLFLCSENTYYVIFTIHHIIADAVSHYLFLKNLSELYNSSGDIDEILKSRPVHNTDYTYFDHVMENAEQDDDKAINFFKLEFENIDSLSLDCLQQKRENGTFCGKTKIFEIDGEQSGFIKEFAGKNNVSVFCFFLSAYLLFLHKISGESVIATGIPVANRMRKKTKSLFGFFINTLPIVVDFTSVKSFKELCALVSGKIFSLLRYQNFDLIKHLNSIIKRNTGNNDVNLFNNVLTFYREEFKFTLNGCLIERIPVRSQFLTYPLICTIENKEESFHFEIDYCRQDFGNLDLKAIWINIINNAIENADDNPANIKMLSREEEAEAARVLSRREKYSIDKMIHEVFVEQAQRHPGKIALKYNKQTVKYMELNVFSNQIAHYLNKRIPREQSRIAVFLNRSTDLIAVILGILKAGKTYVPIDTFCPESRMHYMLEDQGNPVLISESAFRNTLEKISANVLYIDELRQEIENESIANLPVEPDPARIAYIIYTSGSTGNPKGVMISHYNVLRLFAATEKEYRFNQDDIWTLFHSYAFDFSVWEIFGAILKGGRLVIVPQAVCKNPEAFYELLVSERVTVLNQTPSSFRQIIKVDEKSCLGKDLALRYIIFGGEALYFEMLKPWFDRHGDQRPQLVNMYGITETTVHVTYYPVTRNDLVEQRGSVIGRPISDLELYIVDKNLHILPRGIPGEIIVGGEGVSAGYFNRNDLTREKFIYNRFLGNDSRLYRSGDLGRFLPNGDVEYLGRIDKQIQLRGYRVELGEIEAIINTYEKIKDNVVTLHKYADSDERLVAYLVPEASDIAIDEVSLKEHMRKKLPDYMIPSVFIRINEKPLTINGKINYKALPDPVAVDKSADKEAHPLSKLEKEIMGLWSSVLQTKDVKIDDNFFDIGGNSLLVFQVCAQMKDTLNLDELSIVDFYEYPTIRGFADNLRKQNIDWDAEKAPAPKNKEESEEMNVVGQMAHDETRADRRMKILNDRLIRSRLG